MYNSKDDNKVELGFILWFLFSILLVGIATSFALHEGKSDNLISRWNIKDISNSDMDFLAGKMSKYDVIYLKDNISTIKIMELQKKLYYSSGRFYRFKRFENYVIFVDFLSEYNEEKVRKSVYNISNYDNYTIFKLSIIDFFSVNFVFIKNKGWNIKMSTNLIANKSS